MRLVLSRKHLAEAWQIPLIQKKWAAVGQRAELRDWYLSREAADPNRAERQNLIYGKREPDAHARPCDVHEYVGY